MSSNKRLRLLLGSTSSSSAIPKRLRLSDPTSITPGASASSASIQKRFKYDVFISFRGEDTRKTFVSHLYQALKDKSIYTYKDDERIEQGKTINNQLIQAIRGSRLFIIVFSKNYASSSWCLDELVEMMECQKTGEHTAYPVFFDVEPTHVRKQSGAFGKAFLENRNKDAAGKWIEALKRAADLAGRELQATANGDESELIKKIVGLISQELLSISFGSDENLVGMETRVKDVVDSLEMGIDDDVWMIGIKGMGGAGKTTTARAVFDRLSADSDFEAKIFVANVREVSKPSMSGLKKLQKQVLSDVMKEEVTVNDVTHGKNMMQKRMCAIKVLLVLDDVNHIDQLVALAGKTNWFKKGSRIIVTTRDEQVLQAHRVNFRDIDKVDHRVKIQYIDLLSNEEAIFLLSRHAFGRASPPQEFEELAGKVVLYAAGLPLTVKVLGSFLCRKNEHEWVKAIDRLKKFPPEEILEKLELSYESLESYDYQQIFLDIACILKGLRREDAIKILECRGFEPITGLRVLEQRSLITVDKYGFLDMHDQIEEMGKNIVRREHRDEPNKHSRLWIKEEIEDILANDEGTEATICLELFELNTNAGTVMKGLGKMKKLRYLDVNFGNQNYAEDLDNTVHYFSNSLKYLECWNYPFLYLPKTFQAKNLVGLVMEDSRMVQLWEEGEKKVLPKLKFLSLNYCSRLTTFDFGITPTLETLSLIYCPNLVNLFMHVSCQKLNYVCISCPKLRTFNLGLTPNLEELSLNGCADFEELHVSSACPNLKFLELRYSRLRSLDLELFPNLERLDLEGCADFEELKVSSACPNLKFLILRQSRLKLPEDIGQLESLERLVLSATKIKHLPNSICMLKHLTYLNLLDCALLEKLPEDLCQLECLEALYVGSKKIEYLPDSICMLKRLKLLDVRYCCLGKLPEDIGQLESLKRLDLFATKIKHLPNSICMLKHLTYLNLRDCALLEKLPEDLGQLECLEELYVMSKKIEYLPDSICMLKRLKLLYVSDCYCLGKLPEDIGQLESLESLALLAVKIKYLPDSICMLKRLKSLDVRGCSFLGKLPEDIGQLESLERLELSATKIKHLPNSICMLKHLTYLNLRGCALLEKLSEDLGKLECFKNLRIVASPELLLQR